MTKKKWALLILFGALMFGYIKLFYKTYNEEAVAKSADCVILLDVKRITNTLIWNFVTTPEQWNTGNVFNKSAAKEINWKDMLQIPDYVQGFHVKNQPANIWYVVLKVKDETDFNKGLQRYNFNKINSNEYISTVTGIHIFKNGNKILLANTVAENNNYLSDVADEIFIKKMFLPKEKLLKAIAAKSHAAIYIAANKFLQQDGIVTGNFNNNKIEINSTLTPNKQYGFTESSFSFASNSLCTSGFTQPSPEVYNLLSDSIKKDISKALSINIDSVLLPDNKQYNLDIQEIKSRTDSAITYTYDDDFNKLEKVVVNNIQEPAFKFTVLGDNVTFIYKHWLRTNKIDQTDTGQLFVAIPFVKSYCALKNEKELNITAANYKLQQTDKTINCVLFLNILLSKIPADLLKYLPENVINAIANIKSIRLEANKKTEQLIINCILQKKKNSLPLVKL
jgi:hypothetical protein